MDSGELAPGAIVAGHRVERRLGQGGMGAVYAAVELESGRRVALKVLTPELGEEPKFVERFRREAEAAASLMHPNIVRVERLLHAPGEPIAIAMELLEGRSLLQVLGSGALEPERARSIALALASALAAAHTRGIVHRDLKPGNVFLVPVDGGEQVKLLDFGIAKLRESDGYSRLTQTGVLIGTPRFASPEQVLGKRDIDGRSDIFSLGVLLYGMLSGRPPFLGKGARLLIEIQDKEPPALPPSVPSALQRVVERAMRKDPAARFATVSEMHAALEASPAEGGATHFGRAPATRVGMHTPMGATRVEAPTVAAKGLGSEAPTVATKGLGSGAHTAAAKGPASATPATAFASVRAPTSAETPASRQEPARSRTPLTVAVQPHRLPSAAHSPQPRMTPHPAPGRPTHPPRVSRGRKVLISVLGVAAVVTLTSASFLGVMLWRHTHRPAPVEAAADETVGLAVPNVLDRMREDLTPPPPSTASRVEVGSAWRLSYASLRLGGACIEYERRVCQCEAALQTPAVAEARCWRVVAANGDGVRGAAEPEVARQACASRLDEVSTCELGFGTVGVLQTASRIAQECVDYLELCECPTAPTNECHTAFTVIGPSYEGLADAHLTRMFCAERVDILRRTCP